MNGPVPGGEGGAAEEKKSDALKTPSVAADGELESFSAVKSKQPRETEANHYGRTCSFSL
jgi:hypothetical protein